MKYTAVIHKFNGINLISQQKLCYSKHYDKVIAKIKQKFPKCEIITDKISHELIKHNTFWLGATQPYRGKFPKVSTLVYIYTNWNKKK